MNIRYIITSFVRMIFLLISITMISFFLITSSPMNPVDSYLGEISISEEQRAKIEEEWGLNKSPVEQYITWGTHFISGDMGDSISYHEPVSKVLKERFQASLILMGTAWILSGILGFTLGVISGTYKSSILDNIIKTVSLLFASTPRILDRTGNACHFRGGAAMVSSGSCSTGRKTVFPSHRHGTTPSSYTPCFDIEHL